MKGKKVVLSDTEGFAVFDEPVDVMSLPEADARMILGDAVYESMLKHKDDPRLRGTVTVTAIGPDHGTLTLDTGLVRLSPSGDFGVTCSIHGMTLGLDEPVSCPLCTTSAQEKKK